MCEAVSILLSVIINTTYPCTGLSDCVDSEEGQVERHLR